MSGFLYLAMDELKQKGNMGDPYVPFCGVRHIAFLNVTLDLTLQMLLLYDPHSKKFFAKISKFPRGYHTRFFEKNFIV